MGVCFPKKDVRFLFMGDYTQSERKKRFTFPKKRGIINPVRI